MTPSGDNGIVIFFQGSKKSEVIFNNTEVMKREIICLSLIYSYQQDSSS